MLHVKAYAATSPTGPLTPTTIERRAVGPHDVLIEIRYAGISPGSPGCRRDSRHPHRSAGRPCRTGSTVVSVDGDGTVRRCHFVRDELGNLDDSSCRAALAPRPCLLAVCDCHIGYMHLETLPLYDVFAAGVLERIPAGPVPAPGSPLTLSLLPRTDPANR